MQEGLTCREAAAPCCLFCDTRVLEAADMSTAGLSNRDLMHEAVQLGADARWCLERSELVAVYKRAKQVCSSILMSVDQFHVCHTVRLCMFMHACNTSRLCLCPAQGLAQGLLSVANAAPCCHSHDLLRCQVNPESVCHACNVFSLKA